MTDLLPWLHEAHDWAALQPDVDGSVVASTLQGSAQFDARALTAFSANDGRAVGDRRAADYREDGQAGFDEFLVKPFEPERLEAALAKGLISKQAGANRSAGTTEATAGP